MKKNLTFLAIALLLSITSSFSMEKNYFTLTSPDHKIELKVQMKDRIFYSVQHGNEVVINASPISMTINDGVILGAQPKLIQVHKRSVDQEIRPLYGKRKIIRDNFNEVILDFKGNYSLVFRAYNDGVAYRFVTNLKDSIKVVNEEVSYRFDGNPYGNFPLPVDSYETSFEQNFFHGNLLSLDTRKFCFLPLMIDAATHTKVAITESDLLDYPGLYLQKTNDNTSTLAGTFAKYPLKTQAGNYNNFDQVVKERAGYIAQTAGSRSFPWRIMVIADNEMQLADNDMVYKLAKPLALTDTKWIKPGKVSWEWWNNWNLENVPFKTGINDETYRYYIDFAAANHLDYVLMDEGWSNQFDLTKVKPEVDVPGLIKYAQGKGVKVILWCLAYTLDSQLEVALNEFEKWGAAGIKVDFFDRDDQKAINLYEKFAKAAALRHLIVDYHGCSKPTGLSRAYPNVLNYEGILGNEYNKWSEKVTTAHTCFIPYLRMLAGPLDFTPGGMRNAAMGSFSASNSTPMTQGTRCHQLAMYVVYDAPLVMLCDAPTAYQKEPLILDFLSKVPVSWDETKMLYGEVGKYAVVARQKGNEWYIGALTDENAREFNIDCSFLGQGKYKAEIIADGVNANRLGTDYSHSQNELTQKSQFKLNLAQGGGEVVRIYPE
ncbi:MAG: glycoside hydrolase family 97 protein [Bacteroidota bacterium]|nr:glycoside hydrolase family 97 protein [Bacteroidota bacterium]